jgi:hypothetical protein
LLNTTLNIFLEDTMHIRSISLAALSTMLLASCGLFGSNGDPEPVADSAISSLQFEQATTTSILEGSGKGTTFSGPEGLRLAYLFGGENLLIREDIPGSTFPDKQDRIVLLDSQAKTLNILLKSTLAVDKTFSETALNQLGQNLTSLNALDLLDNAHPYRALSADQFLALARKANYDVISQNGQQVVLARTLGSGATETRLQLTFGVAVGAVTTTESTTTSTSPAITARAVSTLEYADVPGVANTRVPSKIDSRITTELAGPTGTTRQVSSLSTVFKNVTINDLKADFFDLVAP